jgi:hypothetical protein
VSVSADPGACATSTKLTLATVTRRANPNGRIGTGRTAVATAPVPATCRWWISGLDTGEYEVELAGPGGSGGMASFTAAPSSSQEIEIPLPAVRVTGTIQTNGRPVEGARLWFMPGPASLLEAPVADGREMRAPFLCTSSRRMGRTRTAASRTPRLRSCAWAFPRGRIRSP